MGFDTDDCDAGDHCSTCVRTSEAFCCICGKPIDHADLESRRIRGAIADVLVNSSNYPRVVGVRMLGQDMSPLIDKVTAAVEATLNLERTASDG